jgi:hypothetical protein
MSAGFWHVWAKRYSGTSGWAAGGPIQVDAGNTSHAGRPTVAMDAAGNALIVYHQQYDASYNYKIVAKQLSAASELSNAVDLTTAGSHLYPRIAMNASGNAVVGWKNEQPGRWDVLAALYTAGGSFGASSWSAPYDVAAYQLFQSVAINAAGDVIVGFAVSGTVNAAIHQAGSWDTGWTVDHSLNVNAANLGAGNDDRGLAVGLDDAGNATAVWNQDWTDGFGHVFASRYRTGHGWGEPTRLDAYGAGSSDTVRLSATPAGNAIAVWDEHEAAMAHVGSARFE